MRQGCVLSVMSFPAFSPKVFFFVVSTPIQVLERCCRCLPFKKVKTGTPFYIFFCFFPFLQRLVSFSPISTSPRSIEESALSSLTVLCSPQHPKSSLFVLLHSPFPLFVPPSLPYQVLSDLSETPSWSTLVIASFPQRINLSGLPHLW